PSRAGQDLAAGGAGDAGNRPRGDRWRGLRRAACRGGCGPRERGDGIGVNAHSPFAHRTPTPLTIAGVTLVADLSGARVWREERLLVVSDLHLEKGSSFAGRGVLLPPYDSAATLARLAAVIAQHNPRTVIALGDSFHDGEAHRRLP